MALSSVIHIELRTHYILFKIIAIPFVYNFDF